ncbi:MAG: hypothetical protein QM774_04305 [Gordonia sp. (in: high G+C Gram-positive bacteria)]|uniref:hypothetical protein n=1 Tax=Gordonia sp. (in: high G+C Gram-positive bacteria) TaxID=84139 RepID=UPI0039E5D402
MAGQDRGGFGDDELEEFYRAIEFRTEMARRPRVRPASNVSYPEHDCPTPEKIAYVSADAATAAILALSAGRRVQALSSYECVCGWWHLTRSHRR